MRASHILIKSDASKPVPKLEEVVERLKKQGEGKFFREFVMQQLGEAKIEASENYKQFLPPSAKPAPAAKSVEKPANAAKKSAPVEKPAAK